MVVKSEVVKGELVEGGENISHTLRVVQVFEKVLSLTNSIPHAFSSGLQFCFLWVFWSKARLQFEQTWHFKAIPFSTSKRTKKIIKF